MREVSHRGESWYSVDDILALFEDNRAWWKKILNRWINGAPTKEFEDLVEAFDLEHSSVLK